jgi:hypothetical protein
MNVPAEVVLADDIARRTAITQFTIDPFSSKPEPDRARQPSSPDALP